MKKLAPITLLLLLAITVSAQPKSDAAPDAAELTKLLNDFLAGASRNDVAVHESFWADDLIYTRSAGRRVNKAEVMHDVRTTPAPKPTDPTTIYTAEDIRIQQYGDTAVVAVSVRLVGNYMGQDIDGRFRYLRVWKSLGDEDWKVIGGSVVTLAAAP